VPDAPAARTECGLDPTFPVIRQPNPRDLENADLGPNEPQALSDKLTFRPEWVRMGFNGRHRTSRVLLQIALAFLTLDGITILGFIRLTTTTDRTSSAVLWLGLATLGLTVAATLCLLYSLAFWADRRWHVFSRWVWPRR